MKRQTKIFVSFIAIYILTGMWGYFRLGWASLKVLPNFQIDPDTRAISLRYGGISIGQRAYTLIGLNDKLGNDPSCEVKVKWYAFFVARVESSYSDMNPSFNFEMADKIYLCVFGMWIPVASYL
jgi:hypothetical protein